MMFGATGQACSLSVVRLNRRFCRAQIVLAHQPRRATTPDGEAVVLQLALHPRAVIGAVRQRERRTDMCQHHHVVALVPIGRAILPGEVAALADAEHPAEAVDRKILPRPIDELEPHRFSFRAKKVVVGFSMSRSCRRISFSCRRRFSSAAIAACGAAPGFSSRQSRLRMIQRTSVDNPTPKFSGRCIKQEHTRTGRAPGKWIVPLGIAYQCLSR